MKRYGYGQYERVDVGVRRTTWEMRHEFLQILVEKRPEAIDALIAAIRFDRLPDELCKPELHLVLSNYVLGATFGVNCDKTKLNEELTDTPLCHFELSLRANAPAIDEVVAESKRQLPSLSDDDHQTWALSRIFPSWETISDRTDTKGLADSVTAWANKYGLASDWILDFALLVLIQHSINMRHVFNGIDVRDLTKVDPQILDRSLEYECRESVGEALLEFYLSNTRITGSEFSDDTPYDTFVFKRNKFAFAQETWMPPYKLRRKFVTSATENFERFVEDVRIVGDFNGINIEKFRDEIAKYCDIVEAAQHSEHPAFIDGYCARLPNESCFYAARWNPVEETREVFVESVIKEIGEKFALYQLMSNDLAVVDSSEFEAELLVYCDRVERTLPAHFQKTPFRHKSCLHFSWLVDFQVSPIKSFQEIADSVIGESRPNADAVRKAIQRCAKDLGLEIRQPARTGRPHGVLDSHVRLPYSKKSPDKSILPQS